jgi:serine/threonine-protein kinase
MGSVWIADHLALGTQVAVKFMSAACAEEAELAERFRREAMAAAQIKSPHVAQVFDHGIAADGAPYIVMELLEGETLRGRMLRPRRMSPAEVARVVGQVAKALGRAHQLGIVHRDIKPDNIFLLDVDGDLFVKVLDFGVAKQAVDGNLGMTSTGSILGTPLYMSPEQLLSAKHVDHRADLWALAVVTYHALTGQLPFTGETLGALSVAVHAGVFTPPSAHRPEISPEVDAWMARALARAPEERFGSAKEMAGALERVLTGGARGVLSSGGDLGAAAAGGEIDAPSQPGSPTAWVDSGARVSRSTAHRLGAAGRRRMPVVIAAAVFGGAAMVGGGIFEVTRRAPTMMEERAPESAAGAEAVASSTPLAVSRAAGVRAAAGAEAKAAPSDINAAQVSAAPGVPAPASPAASSSPASPAASPERGPILARAGAPSRAIPAQTAPLKEAAPTGKSGPTARPASSKDTIGF